ncbi:hypothetical protein BBF96_00085 [Anoxybacter fermentans]|uniref:DZANK-type domain-containing protein n=1 Tax=Anoxybacter fermentans TaxID=1323375 RepID=A0A3Q9HNH4_9FIRM|nr:zinc ribbon domain-containing protein [Anoxybacter fermentans]AZR71943.1 hypothetical protein BBF96_00085 [Anoxybacter fermentans]
MRKKVKYILIGLLNNQVWTLIIAGLAALILLSSAIYISLAKKVEQNFDQIVFSDLKRRFNSILNQEDPKTAFYQEMKKFLEKYSYFKAIYISEMENANESGANKRVKVIWAVPEKLEGQVWTERGWDHSIVEAVGGRGKWTYSYSVISQKVEENMPGHEVTLITSEWRDLNTWFAYRRQAEHILEWSLVIYWLALAFWVYQDARKRKYHPLLWGALTLVTNLVGLVMYLLIRPELQICPQCFIELAEDYNVCPYCGYCLKELCKQCGQGLKEEWEYCPHCGEKKSSL